MTSRSSLVLSVAAIAIAAASAAASAGAQTPAVRQVSLEEAIKLADRSSETVEIARAGVTRARGQQLMARSLYLPQVSASLGYTRTLASQFEGFSFGGPDTNTFKSVCTPNIDPAATPAQRQAALDQAQTCQSSGGGGDFSSVGFGAKNQWAAGLQISQNLFTGGRFRGQTAAAAAGKRAADVELTAQRAQLILDVTLAYYNAVLATRLSEIADATLFFSNDVLRQTTKSREVGSTSEFDLLRAQVTRDNLVPVSLQRRSDRVVATLQLKQLLQFPLDDSLHLTTSIDEAPMPTSALPAAAAAAAGDTTADARATVREAAENVKAQEGLKRAAQADRLPTIAITSGYQRLFFPNTTFPELNDYRENWTIGVSAGVSLFSGGRTRGSVMMADASLKEARARHQQAREFAALDARLAINQLEQAEAAWKASQGTAEQARRAYSIDEIRFREGISTQTDLLQSRLLVEQAMMTRAVAARDLAVARMRLALLKDLPLSAGGSAPSAAAASGAAPQAAPATPPQRSAGATAGTSGSNQQ